MRPFTLLFVASSTATDIPVLQNGQTELSTFQVGTRMTETSKCTGKLCSVTKFRMVSCKANEHMVSRISTAVYLYLFSTDFFCLPSNTVTNTVDPNYQVGGGMYTEFKVRGRIHAKLVTDSFCSFNQTKYQQGSARLIEASFPMKSHDGWVCRNAFGRGDVLCQVQCATYDKDTHIDFKTVVVKSGSKSSGARHATATCPAGYEVMSGGREIQLSSTKQSGSKTFDIRLDKRDTQYESTMPKGNGWYCETGFQTVNLKCFARCAR
jgi:hypothetical protein